MIGSSRSETCEKAIVWACEYIARIRGIPVGEIQANADFSELGLDSIAIVDMTGEMEEVFSVAIDPALAFEHSTVETFVKASFLS